jgi:hypothetical protein
VQLIKRILGKICRTCSKTRGDDDSEGPERGKLCWVLPLVNSATFTLDSSHNSSSSGSLLVMIDGLPRIMWGGDGIAP